MAVTLPFLPGMPLITILCNIPSHANFCYLLPSAREQRLHDTLLSSPVGFFACLFFVFSILKKASLISMLLLKHWGGLVGFFPPLACFSDWNIIYFSVLVISSCYGFFLPCGKTLPKVLLASESYLVFHAPFRSFAKLIFLPALFLSVNKPFPLIFLLPIQAWYLHILACLLLQINIKTDHIYAVLPFFFLLSKLFLAIPSRIALSVHLHDPQSLRDSRKRELILPPSSPNGSTFFALSSTSTCSSP